MWVKNREYTPQRFIYTLRQTCKPKQSIKHLTKTHPRYHNHWNEKVTPIIKKRKSTIHTHVCKTHTPLLYTLHSETYHSPLWGGKHKKIPLFHIFSHIKDCSNVLFSLHLPNSLYRICFVGEEIFQLSLHYGGQPMPYRKKYCLRSEPYWKHRFWKQYYSSKIG